MTPVKGVTAVPIVRVMMICNTHVLASAEMVEFLAIRARGHKRQHEVVNPTASSLN